MIHEGLEDGENWEEGLVFAEFCKHHLGVAGFLLLFRSSPLYGGSMGDELFVPFLG